MVRVIKLNLIGYLRTSEGGSGPDPGLRRPFCVTEQRKSRTGEGKPVHLILTGA